MDNSQNSNVFSLSPRYGDITCSNDIDSVTYSLLMGRITEALDGGTLRISDYTFTSIIEDCHKCITQSLATIATLLDTADVSLDKLCENLENSIRLLQMLTSYVKKLIDFTSVSSLHMKGFPTNTAQILFVVFSHCKDSEIIYGSYLSTVEKQLKDLFRSCHELQITYLMILEKHYAFDLTDKDEEDMLIKALEINLKIGEVVQSLDVKTMAEQWKAYILICEKYSKWLLKSNIYQDCAKLLCMLMETNIKTALEKNQEEKVFLRSIKVASFILKILLKMCTIFRDAPLKNYDHILELLIYIYLNNTAYLEAMCNIPPQQVKVVNSTILVPTDALLKEMMLHEGFVNTLCKCNTDKFRKEDKMLGYIILVITVMRISLEGSPVSVHRLLLDSVFRMLPNCGICFSTNMKFSNISHQPMGLFEYMLGHTLRFVTTLNGEGYSVLERYMYEALLGIDAWSGLFASYLWTLLARGSHRQLLVKQLTFLCQTYKHLEKNGLFSKSPQEVHLRHTIRKLFQQMHTDDKIKIHRHFNIYNSENVSLYECFEICNFPDNIRKDIEEFVVDSLKEKFDEFFAARLNDVYALIKTMRLATTFTCKEQSIEKHLLKSWTKLCPKSNKISSIDNMCIECVWFLDYVQANASLMAAMGLFNNATNVLKILHIISLMAETANRGLKLIIIPLLFKIATKINDENSKIENMLIKTFSSLFKTDALIENVLTNLISKYKEDSNIKVIMKKVAYENDSVNLLWRNIRDGKEMSNNRDANDISTIDSKYQHVCVDSMNFIDLSGTSSVVEVKECSSNFDFADIDTLFEVNSEEPVTKKMKYDSKEVDDVVSRLEKDALLLCKLKENVTNEHKERLRAVCNSISKIF